MYVAEGCLRVVDRTEGEAGAVGGGAEAGSVGATPAR